MILIIHTERSHIAAMLAGLAILFTLAGFLYSQRQNADNQASIVRAYYGARETEYRLADAEHRAKDLDFFYDYAIKLADSEANHEPHN